MNTSSGRMAAVLALGATLLAAPLTAAPLYTVVFQSGGLENSVSSASPFGRDSAYALAPSAGTGDAAGQGRAREGRVAATHRMDIGWNGGSGAYSSGTYATTYTDDFLITGPAGPVAGTLNLRLQSAHALTGGYVGHGAHQSQVVVEIQVRQAFWPFAGIAQVYGDFLFTNAGPFSSGCLAGQSGPNLDVPIAVSANFPVNVPFAVQLRVRSQGGAYGNAGTNPGMILCDAGGNSSSPLGAGLRLESVNGEILTLPDGYTLNAPSWGIANNGSTLVGVADAPPASRLRLRVAGANPSSRESRVVLDLPRDARVQVDVCDVAGRVVRSLADGWHAAGPHELVWDGRTADGRTAAPGLYFVRGASSSEQGTVRLVRIR